MALRSAADQGRLRVTTLGPSALFELIVCDFATIRQAYLKAGLLSAGKKSALGLKLWGGEAEARRFRREFLLLEALARHRLAWLVMDGPDHRQVVVFGGTNVGKSTVVNVLAGASIAAASAEGGHTQNAQCFAPVPPPFGTPNQHAYENFKIVERERLSAGQHDLIGWTCLSLNGLGPSIALWDTPDCDSTGSPRYLEAVIEVIAAADLLVYVTSVEKYAVNELVEWVFDLSDVGIPILECLNKTPRKDRDTVIRRQRETIFPEASSRLGIPPPDFPIVALRYLVEGNESDLWGDAHPEAGELRAKVKELSGRTDRHRSGAAALNYLGRAIDGVLEPISLEASARALWDSAIADAMKKFVSTYELQYLTSDKLIEPFTRLNLKLLELLDPNIPGLKQGLAWARRAIFWQRSLILKGYRHLVRVLSNAGEAAADPGAGQPAELKAYAEAHVELLAMMSRLITSSRSMPRHHPFWDMVEQEWQQQYEEVSKEFGELIKKHMTDTERRITEAARDIFQELQKQPLLLNILRTARVTADAGGLVIALAHPHFGLIHGALDDALGSAMVLATETGMAQAARAYVEGRRKKLRTELVKEAQGMAETLYGERLRSLAVNAMSRAGALGIGEQVVKRLPENLRMLAEKTGAEAP